MAHAAPFETFEVQHIQITPPPGQVVLATLIEFNGITGRALRAAAAPLHRAVARCRLNALSSLTPENTWPLGLKSTVGQRV